ncbi:MAG: HDIG domain-containing protein [Firmicutes bacterium]|nr:HDIG domain-containing protein [Bacillota bacterium]
MKLTRGKIPLEKKQVAKVVTFFGIASIVAIAAAVLRLGILTDETFENWYAYLMVAVGILFFTAAFLTYLLQTRRVLFKSPKILCATGTAIVIVFVVNIFLSHISLFLMPAYLTAFIVAPLVRRRVAFVSNLFANFLITFVLLAQYLQAPYFVDIYAVLSMFLVGIALGSIAAYTISVDVRRFHYIAKGFIIATIAYFLLISLHFSFAPTVNFDIFWIAAIGVYSPIIVGMILQPMFEMIFNLITNSKLVEITDHNHPLIKRLREETPGTYNHCLTVANFAEICATEIGENPYLARACAYYHDVGKLANAVYYKENQGDSNPHDDLLPEVSADIIRSHTYEGLKLCEKHRIPAEVKNVTIEHHGTLPIPVFYNKAKNFTDSDVDISEYSYKGKTPTTKINAIIMICDAAEAAIRSMTNPDAESVDKLLSALINERITQKQFDNCDISLKELNIIKHTIINVFGGLYHKRLKYN